MRKQRHKEINEFAQGHKFDKPEIQNFVYYKARDTSVSQFRKQENLLFGAVKIQEVNFVKPLDENVASSY